MSTEIGYILLFININNDKALRLLRDNFRCHIVSLGKKLINRLLNRNIILTIFLKKNTHINVINVLFKKSYIV